MSYVDRHRFFLCQVLRLLALRGAENLDLSEQRHGLLEGNHILRAHDLLNVHAAALDAGKSGAEEVEKCEEAQLIEFVDRV